MSRTYDIELECGCLISLDGGGGVMPCHYDDSDLNQVDRCNRAWKRYKESSLYEEHNKEISIRNR